MFFDAFIIVISLVLAIKGFLNGMVREIAGLIGVIGGFYIASRFYDKAGEFINNNLLNIPNKSAVDLVGFIGVFLLFWSICVFLGFLFNKILKISALGFLDRLFGFIFGGLKFFLIISIIIASLYRIDFLRDKLEKLAKNSQVFPILIEVGSEIMKFNSTFDNKDVKISLNNLKGD